jgi:hypothetical protein
MVPTAAASATARDFACGGLASNISGLENERRTPHRTVYNATHLRSGVQADPVLFVAYSISMIRFGFTILRVLPIPRPEVTT